MRALALLASQAMLVAIAATGASAAQPDNTLRASREGLTLATPELKASMRGTQDSGLNRAEVSLDFDSVQAKLFRNAGVVGEFGASRLGFGRMLRSPYFGRVGIGDGVVTHLSDGPYSATGALLSGPKGDSALAEVVLLKGLLTLQGGHKQSAHAVGTTSFAGAHIDVALPRVDLSLRWHAGVEEVSSGERPTSAGSIAIGVSSVFKDGDRLRAAMSRPVRPSFEVENPDFELAYDFPVPIGRLTCSGGTGRGRYRAGEVQATWGFIW